MFNEETIKSLSDLSLGQDQPLSDHITFRGRVLCTYEDIETGRSGVLHYKDNMIVNLARENMCYLLAASQSDRYVKTFKIGKNGHSGSDILTPVPPVITDSALKDGSPFTKNLASNVMLPSSGTKNEIQFKVSLEPNEANGSGGASVVYTEAGMFTAKNQMFCRETFPGIVKTSARRINFAWSILF